MNVVSEEFWVVFTQTVFYSAFVFCPFFFFSFFAFYVFLSITAVFEPFSQGKKTPSGLVFRKLFYIYVSYFYIFFYAYLLHIVVYITVVWIDTIIYFSMKNTLEANKNPKMWFWEMKFVLTKNCLKKKSVLCKLDFCFKLRK